MKIDKENNLGEIRLSSGHTLIMGHKPPKIKIEALSRQLQEGSNTNIEHFGLFETATPNYTTYYPEVTAEDLNPADAEFITPVFRMLSEVIVYKGVPIDFSKKGVLKASMSKLVGQTINIDHEIAVGNAIGAISEVYWQNSYKDTQGRVIPAGINGVMKIDGKSNPRIARGIMMEPPSIHSNSVTVNFKWEPSHKFDERQEFYDKLGTYTKEGELIRLVVTKVRNYHETSLVSHGADVFAQKIGKDGKIVNPDYANANYHFNKDKTIVGFSWIDYKNPEISLQSDTTILTGNNNNDSSNHKENEMDEKLIKEMALLLGLEDVEAINEDLLKETKVKMEAAETKRQEIETENTNLKTQLSEKENEITSLEEAKDELVKDKALVDQVREDTRKEAIRLFKLCKGEEADENIINLISTSTLETASAFVKQYQKEVEEKFAPTCKSCGSNDISRSTALTSKDGVVNNKGEEQGGNNQSGKDTMEVIAAMRKKGRKSILFPNLEK